MKKLFGREIVGYVVTWGKGLNRRTLEFRTLENATQFMNELILDEGEPDAELKYKWKEKEIKTKLTK